jgi:hypothetical protein
MGRPHRIERANGFFHVATRGNDGMSIYPSTADRRSWVRTLAHAIQLARWRCVCWAQVGNHYHAVVLTPEPTLAYGMHVLNTLHAKNVNSRHGRRDHLFGARYRSQPIETQAHLLRALRYVARNPFAAGLCADPAGWPWSSYGLAAAGKPAPGVDTTLLALVLGTTGRATAAAYRALVDDDAFDLRDEERAMLEA